MNKMGRVQSLVGPHRLAAQFSIDLYHDGQGKATTFKAKADILWPQAKAKAKA